MADRHLGGLVPGGHEGLPDVPKGFVTDEAGIIDAATRRQLIALNQELEQNSRRQAELVELLFFLFSKNLVTKCARPKIRIFEFLAKIR